MDFSAVELQIFVSLAVVLGVVFVAFLTDFLKGNNEALRERNIELVVRQEERERHQAEMTAFRSQTVAAQAMRVAPSAIPPVTASMPVAVSPESPVFETEPPLIQIDPEPEAWATEEELAEIDEMAARIQENAVAIEMSTPPAARVSEWEEAEPPAISLESDPAEAAEGFIPDDLSEFESQTEAGDEPVETLVGEAAEEAARVEDPDEPEEPDEEDEVSAETVTTGENGDFPRLTIHAKVTPIDVISAERAAASETFFLARELERVAELSVSELLRDGTEEASESSSGQSFVAEEVAPEETYTEPVIPEEPAGIEEDPTASESTHPDTEWTDQEEEKSEGESATARPLEMPNRWETEAEQIRIPTGFQDYALLATAMNSKALFRGTAVAISISGMSGSEESEEIVAFLESLLTPSDFACQSSEDEFLLILPDETGAGAQRRLQHISQRLWDYQIRSMGKRALMFSWGAAEISGEPLRDAIGAAKDRMWQTRRNRERHSAEIHHYKIRVAND